MSLIFRCVAGVVGLVSMAGLARAWEKGYISSRLWEAKQPPLATIEADRGDLAVFVTETGTVESAANTTVKCQVEALMGLVGGTSKSGSAGGQGSGQNASGTGTQAANAASAGVSKTATAAATKAGATKASAKAAPAKAGASATASTATSTSTATTATGTAAAGSTTGTTGASGTGTSTTTVTPRPTIRSFSYTVAPYTSLRPATKATTASTGTSKSASGGMAGGGGNRGGGGSSQGAGGTQEKPGSTRIIMIKPEGTQVSAGDVVCELDSAAFRDALTAQQIKYDQAKAWVVQARSILEVNEISLREYRDGIYPQDLMLVRQYLNTCRKEEDRARKNLAWSEPVYQKGFRTRAQYEADLLNVTRSQIALAEAERMEERLLKYTGPKLLKSLQAKLEANRADTLAQESAFQLESDRLKRLQKMVANCTLKAPHEGIVVYSLGPQEGWRPATTQIQEGATVREGQSIFELPDANKMRVRAKVNESKVGAIRAGQKASIRVDAFPSKILTGTVTEVTLIPAQANGPSSDIRVYYANVTIDSGGFEGLRPGLSAEVSFFVDSRRDSTRLPLQSVRWVDQTPFAAVATALDGSSYRWQPIEVGLMNESYAEVLTGLKPGDRVVAHPQLLAFPPLTPKPTLQASRETGRTEG